eukprot:118346-Hanusia_phi.AAC.1
MGTGMKTFESAPQNKLVRLRQSGSCSNDGEEGGEESGEEDEDEPKIQDVSGQPDWPSDLPGAMGDDTSWIVGMHREPFWSDSMTHSCGLTTPCEKGRADRGHGFQKATNPWVDKRRTFDPYAQSSETGRKNYPWDPSKDPKYYGKADCSDGKLTKDCFEKPSDEDLEKKQAEWRAKYDEWHTGKGEVIENADVGVREEEAEAAQQEQKKSSGGNAILHMPDEVENFMIKITPWAHSLKRGQLAMKEARGHFTGGEPVVKSLGRVVHKIQDDFASAKNMLSSNSFTTLEKKFLRAHSNHKTSAFHTKYQSTLQSLVSEPSAKFANRQKESASIWESPSAVKLHGVYGKGNKFAEESPKSEQRAAPKAASEVQKQAAIKGPLPSVRSDAEWVKKPLLMLVLGLTSSLVQVVSAEGKHAEHKGKASTKPWEETQIQKGVLRRENTLANLGKNCSCQGADLTLEDAESAIEHHDNQLLQKQSGLTIPQLKALEKSAGDLEKKLMAKHEGDHGKGTKMPSLKVQHKLKVVRHLRDKVMAILAKREEELFSKKSGWKSEKDLDRAEKFAENLSLEIKRRRAEEKLHPLIPKDVLSVTKDQMKPDPALHLKVALACPSKFPPR